MMRCTHGKWRGTERMNNTIFANCASKKAYATRSHRTWWPPASRPSRAFSPPAACPSAPPSRQAWASAERAPPPSPLSCLPSRVGIPWEKNEKVIREIYIYIYILYFVPEITPVSCPLNFHSTNRGVCTQWVFTTWTPLQSCNERTNRERSATPGDHENCPWCRWKQICGFLLSFIYLLDLVTFMALIQRWAPRITIKKKSNAMKNKEATINSRSLSIASRDKTLMHFSM